MKPGTRIQIRGFGVDNSERWETGRIVKIMPYMLPLPAGYYPVRFDADGARLLVHESGFRVIDNRGAA